LGRMWIAYRLMSGVTLIRLLEDDNLAVSWRADLVILIIYSISGVAIVRQSVALATGSCYKPWTSTPRHRMPQRGMSAKSRAEEAKG